MGLNNYTWTVPGVAQRSSDSRSNLNMSLSLEGAEVNTDEGSGTLAVTTSASLVGAGAAVNVGGRIFRASDIRVDPVSDFFLKTRNGKFAFIFNEDGPKDATTSFAGSRPVKILSESRFTFFRQGTDEAELTDGGYFQFSCYKNQVGGGPQTLTMLLRAVNRPLINYSTFLPLEQTVILWEEEAPTSPTNGMVFQIEWVTNNAEDVPLSSDKTAPSLPELTFIFRRTTDSTDPDDAEVVLCHTVDLATLSALDPLDGNFRGEALLTHGVAHKKVFDALFNAYASQPSSQTVIVPVTFQLSAGSFFQSNYLASRGSLFITNGFVQDYWALNARREDGFIFAADGRSGLLEPAANEYWEPHGNCIGWRFDKVGISELAILIIEEFWSDPGSPSPVLIQEEFWPAPAPLTPTLEQGETWEPPAALTPTLEQGETWES